MREALALLTTVGGARPLTTRALPWFPAVGAFVGAVVGVAWWATGEWWPPAVAAGLAVATDLALTGLLHVDGLADSADGLLPHATRARRLEIMRSPGVGAYACAVVGATLLLRVTALSSTAPEPIVVAAIWCAVRATVASVPATIVPARSDGLAAALAAQGAPRWPVTATVPAAVAAALVAGVAGLAAVLVAATVVVGVVMLGARRLGGFTGDVLGAAIVLGETAGLVALSARG
jgi:adenosylcobinamide-GDP ribazoletransferase